MKRIARRTGTGPAPLSFSQQRLWFLDQWEPGAPTFNGARALRIRGEIDLEALESALALIVERHESMRTVFRVVGREPRQVVLEEWTFRLPVIDLSGLRARERPAELSRLLRELSREPFDLTSDLMLRGTVFRLDTDHHVLLLRLHHIAADAFAVEIIFREVAEAYGALRDGRRPELPAPPLQYADFACWQHERLQGDVLDELAAYWRRELQGAPELLALPTDRPRLPVQRHEGGREELYLPAGVSTQVRDRAREQRCTVYMLMLGAFATLLYRLSGVDDIVVGTPIANRVTSELLAIVGFFSNTIAIRARLGGNPTFREVCERVREAALGAYEHQDLPFERVVDLLNVRRDPGYNPVFQVNFRAEDGARQPLRLAGAETALLPVDIGFSRFDLALEVHVADEGVDGYFEYDRDLFDAETVARISEDFAAVLEQVLADPDVPVLSVRLPHGRRTGTESSPRARMQRRRNASRSS